MNILLVSATEFEGKTILEKIKSESIHHQVELLVTGVGMTATAFALGKCFATKGYNLAINIGLAGAFDRKLTLGEVVDVVEDQFSEEGAEDGDEFLTLNDLGLRKNEQSTLNGKLKNSFELNNSKLKKVRGITANTVHGNEVSIKKVMARLNPQVETMEGAAFFYASHMSDISCLQIRGISNYVEKRNREVWEIDKAMENLTEEVINILKSI